MEVGGVMEQERRLAGPTALCTGHGSSDWQSYQNRVFSSLSQSWSTCHFPHTSYFCNKKAVGF